MRHSLLLVTLAASFLTGCASNPFTRFYQSYTNQMPVTVQQRLLPPTATPQVVSVAPQGFREQTRQLMEQGLICVGGSEFRGGAPTQRQLVDQAKTVGADVVVFTSQYSHTEQGIASILNYHPGQTYTTTQYGTVNANAYGSGGYAYGSGSYSGYSTTTTPGTFDTQYVPYQRAIYDYAAAFWRHAKPGILGARLLPIPETMRSTLQRNTGVLVDVVILNSPAFRANIFPGDVIIQIADKPVETVPELMDLLPTYAGKTVLFKILRDSQTRDIDVRLNAE